MLRALIRTGNPVAPFFNAWFPNPYFYPLTEGQYHTQVRSYGTNSLGEAVVDLLFHGAKVHGLIGPVFVLLPLALLGIRRPAVRKLLAGGALLSGLWLLNHGARFVMPALPLLSLALAVVLPARVAQVVVLVHALLSWPHALRLNMPGEGSLLAGIPWKAALRIESEDAYLRRVSFDYNVALMLEQHVPRGAKVLDLFGAPEAYLRSRLVGQYQSAEGVRASEALRLAWRPEPGMLYFYDARWPVQGLTAVRIALAENGATPWSVQEVQLMRNGEAVRAGPGWEVDAEPNIWESNLAADRNLLTAWSTRQPMRPGDWWQVDFQKPELLDSLRVLSPWAQRPKRFEVLGRTTDGFWRKLADTAHGAPHIPMNLRFAATRTLARWGIRHILTMTGPAGFGPVGASMLDAPHDWGLELLGCHEQVCLFKVR